LHCHSFLVLDKPIEILLIEKNAIAEFEKGNVAVPGEVPHIPYGCAEIHGSCIDI
jgi:hypothetical protein